MVTYVYYTKLISNFHLQTQQEKNVVKKKFEIESPAQNVDIGNVTDGSGESTKEINVNEVRNFTLES